MQYVTLIKIATVTGDFCPILALLNDDTV